MFVFSTIAIITVFFLAIVFLGSLFLACRSFEAAFTIVVILFCLDAVTVGLPILFVGKNIQVFDPIAVGLFLAGMIRLTFGAQKNMGAPQWLLISLLILMSIPLGLGFKQYGMAAAPDFRFFFHFLAMALYASSFNFDQINFNRLATCLLWAGLMLIMLALFRWSAGAAGLGIADTWRSVGASREFRVLNAAQTFFIAQVGLLLLIIRVSDRSNMEAGNQKAGSRVLSKQLSPMWRRWAVGLSGIGLAISFGLMHRSIWVCMIAGVALLALLDQRHRADLARVFSVFTIAGLVILVPLGLLGFLDSFMESMGAAFTETTERHSSFADRYMGWEVLLGEWWSTGNILTYALGQPFGSGYFRKIAEFGSSYSAEYTPHNFYVQTLLRTGIIGLILLISLIISTGVGVYQTLFKMKKDRGLEFSVELFLLLSILMQVVYFMAYGARLEQGLLFGLAMGAASVKARLPDNSFSSKRLMSCRQ